MNPGSKRPPLADLKNPGWDNLIPNEQDCNSLWEDEHTNLECSQVQIPWGTHELSETPFYLCGLADAEWNQEMTHLASQIANFWKHLGHLFEQRNWSGQQ